MKWKKFLWSLALWILIVLCLVVLSNTGEGSKGKLGVFPLFVIVWSVVSVLSVLFLLLRLLKIYRGNRSFFYVFVGQANGAVATYGFYQVFSPSARENLYGIILLLAANAAMAFVILRDYLTTDD